MITSSFMPDGGQLMGSAFVKTFESIRYESLLRCKEVFGNMSNVKMM